jgi:hypothetical protein
VTIGSNGTLNGAGTITASGLTSWISGELAGTSSQIYNANGGISFTVSSGKALDGRTLNVSGTSTASGTHNLTLRDGATINHSGTWTISDTVGMAVAGSGPNTFNNLAGAVFTKAAGGGTTNIGTVFSNDGTVNVNSSTLALNGAVTQHSGTTLTGGTWNVTNGSTLNITLGSDIQTIGSAATVKLDGAGSSFARVTTALNNNQGTFHLANNRDYTTAGNLANSGTLRVEDATTLVTVNGILTQSAGNTNLVNGGALAANAFNLNGGFLSGTGSVTLALNGDLIAAGGAKLSPGNSAGTMAINLSGTGDFDLSGAVSSMNSDALIFEIGAQGSSDLITVSGGPLIIGAGLLEFDDFDFSTLAGFAPYSTHTLFDGNTQILGTLGTNLTGQIGGFGAAISLADGGNDLVLNVVPEPGTTLVGILLLGVAVGRRRRR